MTWKLFWQWRENLCLTAEQRTSSLSLSGVGSFQILRHTAGTLSINVSGGLKKQLAEVDCIRR